MNSHFQGFLCDSLHGRARPGASPLSDLRSSQFLLLPSRPKGCTIFKTRCHRFVSSVACCPVFCHSRFYHSSTSPHPNHLSVTVAHTLQHRPLCTVLIKFHYFDHSPQFCPKFTIYKNRQTQTSWSLFRTCSSATGFVFLTLT